MNEVVDKVVDVGAAVDNQKKMVGERLRIARKASGMTQKAFCAVIGKPVPSLQDYEAGKTMPGGDAVAAMVRAGINANWLLTGAGEMLVAPKVVSYASSVDIAPQANSDRRAYQVLNSDAMIRAICVMVATAKNGEPIETTARKAVEFYNYCMENELISPTGEGSGHGSKNAG